MFTSKQLSTIKQALEDKEMQGASIINEERIFDHDLILGTARLQQIYKEVCNEEKPNRGKPYPNNSLFAVERNYYEKPGSLVQSILVENEFLKKKLSAALTKMEEEKMSMQRRMLGKIKKMEGDLKKHLLLEENWKKSKDALIKENKGLVEDLTMAESRLKDVQRSRAGRSRVKKRVTKSGIPTPNLGDGGRKRIPVSRSEGRLEKRNIKRSASAVHLKLKERMRKRKQHSEKLRKIRLEAMKGKEAFSSLNKKFHSSQSPFQKKPNHSNENMANTYLKQISHLQNVTEYL